jgi:hypothetical protein
VFVVQRYQRGGGMTGYWLRRVKEVPFCPETYSGQLRSASWTRRPWTSTPSPSPIAPPPTDRERGKGSYSRRGWHLLWGHLRCGEKSWAAGEGQGGTPGEAESCRRDSMAATAHLSGGVAEGRRAPPLAGRGASR